MSRRPLRTSLDMERLWQVIAEGEAEARRPERRFAPYALALGLTLLGFALRLWLEPVLAGRSMFLLFMPAVLSAALVGGLWPGLTAVGLSSAAGAFLLFREGFGPLGQLDTLIFLALGGVIAILGERFKRVRQEVGETNQQLIERDSYLQSLLNAVPDGMIVIDEQGRIQSFSPVAERQFGWTPNEVVGRNVTMLMPTPDREAHDDYLGRYHQTGVRHIIGIGRLVVGQRKDGSTFPMELAVGEMRTHGHRFYTGFIRDITDKKDAETRLQKLQAELVHISRLSAMGEMAATLAHELNQPLSAISNYLNGGRRLLDQEQPGSRASQALEKAAEQALRAGQIIRRLREFVSRGESERRVESLNAMVSEANALALLDAHERGVRVRFKRDPRVDLVLADKIQIQQVALNLIRNAIEAMAGCDKRELTIAVTELDDDMAQVSVADTGSGISPSIADQLFQPFVTTKGGQGMGVGLSICRTIIEAHGGRIWAESNEGGGTVFNFTLRRADAEAMG